MMRKETIKGHTLPVLQCDKQYGGLLEQVSQYAFDYINTIYQKPPFPDEKAIQELNVFDEELPFDGVDAFAVIKQLHEIGSPATTAEIGGRFFGFVNGGLFPVAHAAEWLADTWNQNSALYVMSPVTSKLEMICELWIVQLLRLEPQTAMGLVTGSSNAIICALAAARNELLNRQGYSISEKGFRNAPPLHVLISEEAHSSVKAALSVLGFGTDEIEMLATDELGRIKIETVPKLDKNTLLILQAGNVNGGSFDPIDKLCDMARAAGAWVHIDGAFGLWAAASKKYRVLTKGIEKADSWSVAAHKTLNAGYDCGIVLCRHRNALVSALQANGSYIAYGTQRDGMLYTTEMSRRARAIPLWAVLKTLGSSGVENLVDTLCGHTEYFAEQLKKVGYTLVNPPVFNQFMIACETEEQTAQILRIVQNSGICWCSGSQWKGKNIIRISVCSHMTTKNDIDISVAVFKAAYEEVFS